MPVQVIRFINDFETRRLELIPHVLKQPLSENAARKSCDWDSDFLTQIGEARGVQSLN